MTHRPAAILLSTTLAACVPTQGPTAQQTPPATQAAPDEAAFALAPMPPAPAAPPVVKPAWIKRIQTLGVTGKDGEINMAAQSIQPLYQAAGKTDTVFTQVNIASSAQTDTPTGTSNIGLGYRKLIERDLMVGINGFYDRDWAQEAERAGADAELRWRGFNLSTNYYVGQDNADGLSVPDGYDIRLGSQVPYLPWAQATFTMTDLFTEDGTVTETYAAGVKMDLMKYVQLEAGLRGDGTSPEAGMVKLSFNLLPGQWGPQRRTAFGNTPVSDNILEARDLTMVTLDKVKRDNTIHIVD